VVTSVVVVDEVEVLVDDDVVVDEVEVLVVDDVLLDVVDVDVLDVVVDEVASAWPVAAPAVPLTSNTTAPLTIITAASARVRNPPMFRLPLPAPGRA
jgi:UDP:flavonoid glycosyltransferase YjiC (YdhE family)